MLPDLFLMPSFQLLERTAAFTELRHDVLAGNIANISTPNYHARDLPVKEFEQALARATAKQNESTPNATNTSQVMEELRRPELYQVKDRDPINLTFQDGARRSIEQEALELSKNSMLQNYTVELMAAQMQLLQMVTSERLS